MLSEEERARIIADESLRAEIRATVTIGQQVSTRKARFVAFLNKPLGLWLLTTVLLGIVTWAYSLMAASVQSRHDNAVAIDKLNKQGGIRLEVALKRITTASTRDDYDRVLNTLLEDTAEIRLSPDFKGRSTFSLFWEIRERERAGPDDHNLKAMLLLVDLSDARAMLQKVPPADDAELSKLKTAIREKLAQLDDL